MSRWILALMFSFGTVSFLTGCPAEEKPADKAGDAAKDAGDAAKDAGDAAKDAAGEATDAAKDAAPATN